MMDKDRTLTKLKNLCGDYAWLHYGDDPWQYAEEKAECREDFVAAWDKAIGLGCTDDEIMEYIGGYTWDSAKWLVKDSRVLERSE